MALHTSANDLAFEDIESSATASLSHGACSRGSHGAGSAFLHRQAGLGAVERAWICDFSSTERTMAWAGGSTFKARNQCARLACNEPDGNPFQDSNVRFDLLASGGARRKPDGPARALRRG